MQYFDVQSKTWKTLPSMAQLSDATACFCAEYVGNYLYVAAKRENDFVNYRYHIVSNTWETLPSFSGLANQINCLCSIEDHVYAIYQSRAPYRYHIATNQWQYVAKSSAVCNISPSSFCNKAAVVLRSCIYVIHGQAQHSQYRNQWDDLRDKWDPKVAVLYCFDPKRNAWEQKSSTTHSHFGASLFVVNGRLFIVGGHCSINSRNGEPYGNAASVEVYDEENNTWSVVEQPHIPPNNLGAIEVEGRVYFMINNLPVESGIRIPPGEVYHVPLDEWENLGKVDKSAILCYVSAKTENLTAE